MDNVECVVIGAGVVGLAIARTLARSGREVIVLEATNGIGNGTSSRNSEVIHAGIYYPTGSLMAELCVRGKHALYDYCDSHGVPYKRCGKLIVATTDIEVGKLAAIQAQAAANGVADLTLLSAAEAQAMEPALACKAALLSPSTGIVDSHALMLALQGDAEAADAAFAFEAPLLGADITQNGFVLDVGGAAPLQLGCTMLINAAGLGAVAAATSLKGMPRELIPRAYLAKGNYFSCAARAPFTHLIYPVPEPGGLGVHLTLDMGGQAKFGPDVEWVETLDYEVDPSRAARFYPAIRRYWPSLPDGALMPSYSGIRPKIVPPDIAKQDFLIQGPATHHIPGLINLFGIESPGLTSSLAIADEVAAMTLKPIE